MKKERIHLLNQKAYNPNGKFILYRMQASVRVHCNLALNEAIRIANELELPLLVVFYLDDRFPEANYRHFQFLTEGLQDFSAKALSLGIRFEIHTGDFEKAITSLLPDAACVVTDKGYLRIQREWRDVLIRLVACRLVEIEDNLVIPIESASVKAAWAARTLRPHLLEKMDYFITDAAESPLPLKHKTPWDEQQAGQNDKIMAATMQHLKLSAWLTPGHLRGGEDNAYRLLHDFIIQKLPGYSGNRNDPSQKATSQLSAYLHFGQISPLTILEAAKKNPFATAYIEELVVRRELAHNYIYYTPAYDSYEALPAWCKKTLAIHAGDKRPHLYTREQLEQATTHDECWNAAMREMTESGFMENTMRMYWGKKIIEWSPAPEEAYQLIRYLNNRYFNDGRDANSYAGISWCFGLHDRPWQERPVFGTIRYMNEAGLRRKYNMNDYIRQHSPH